MLLIGLYLTTLINSTIELILCQGIFSLFLGFFTSTIDSRTKSAIIISSKTRRKTMPIKIHLSKLLGERKLRASDVAKKTGINKNTLSALYNENVSGIKFDTLEKLCKFLDCKVGDLVEYVEEGE